jgi:hypothetical protein
VVKSEVGSIILGIMQIWFEILMEKKVFEKLNCKKIGEDICKHIEIISMVGSGWQ